MRRLLLALVVMALSGCTASWPATSRVVAEVSAGDLGPGERLVHNLTLAAPAGFLAVGHREGPAHRVHVALRAPDGALWAARAGEAHDQPCAVTNATAGAWALEVWPDLRGGSLRGGKYTVRADPGPVPAAFPCRDDAFPGRGAVLGLGAWELNLTAGANASLAFDQPWDLAALRIAGPPPGANATNLTLQLAPPGGEPLVPDALPRPPPRGAWVLHARLAEGAEHLLNQTIAVEGIGS